MTNDIWCIQIQLPVTLIIKDQRQNLQCVITVIKALTPTHLLYNYLDVAIKP